MMTDEQKTQVAALFDAQRTAERTMREMNLRYGVAWLDSQPSLNELTTGERELTAAVEAFKAAYAAWRNLIVEIMPTDTNAKLLPTEPDTESEEGWLGDLRKEIVKAKEA